MVEHRKKFLTKLRSGFRAFLGFDSKQAAGDDFAKNYTLTYVSVLLGGGIALSFGQLRDEPWFAQPTPEMFWSHLLDILTLVWVYFTVLLSGWGTYGSAKDHPIKSQKRFFCTWVILIFYFPTFLKFKDLGAELFLQIPIFLLFVLWDLLKEKEYPDERATMRPRTLVTVRWTIIFALTYGIFTLFAHPSLVDYGFLAFVYIAMRLYRLNKDTSFLLLRGHRIL